MFKRNLMPRVAALGASVAVTFAVVAMIADYGLPSEQAAQILVQATVQTAVK